MTTIRDYLKDFAVEVANIDADSTLEYEAEIERIVDEYTGLIKERIVG